MNTKQHNLHRNSFVRLQNVDSWVITRRDIYEDILINFKTHELLEPVDYKKLTAFQQSKSLTLLTAISIFQEEHTLLVVTWTEPTYKQIQALLIR